MENGGMQGGMLPNLGSNMLGLELPLHPHHAQHHNPSLQQQQYSQHQHQQHQQMVNFNSHDTGHLAQSPQCVKQSGYPPNATKGKQTQQQQQQLGLSDDDELGFAAEDGSGDGRKRVSPWQRVKWTDNMVRLLIMVVFYIGDDGCPEGSDAPGVNKKKAGAMLQKKGKWKSVSKAMMEKGFYVSPQQCEDKFNDLNKRYKRVNDILGKGTACRVVENQSLLETMDQLSPKMKEEARKLLNSKHLFFREMCAYHNSGAHHSSESAGELANNPQQHQQQQQQLCFHSQEGVETTNLRNRTVRGGMQEDHDEDDDNEEDEEDMDEDEDEDSEDEEEMQDVGVSGKSFNEHSGGEITDKFSSRKKQRSMISSSTSTMPLMQQLSSELASILQDGTKSPWEQRQWMRSRSLQLEEQQLTYQSQAFELEKQRMKWAKFSWKKEREMERIKLNNDRTRLENKRMVLILHQKELQLLDLPRQQGSSIKLPDLDKLSK
ncbi:hypothetical protein ACHQM5_009894 [Ranunculus cassubicifolius]